MYINNDETKTPKDYMPRRRSQGKPGTKCRFPNARCWNRHPQNIMSPAKQLLDLANSNSHLQPGTALLGRQGETVNNQMTPSFVKSQPRVHLYMLIIPQTMHDYH